VSLLVPALLSQRQNQPDDVRVLGPLGRGGSAQSFTAKARNRCIATDPGPRIISGLETLMAIPLHVIVMVVTDDRVLIEYRRWEMENRAIGDMSLFAGEHQGGILFAEHMKC
jgi:hypothetical protein